MMTYQDDWRERHGPRRSGSRVIIYIILLIIIILIMTKAGDFSRQFYNIFLNPSGQTEPAGETTE